MRFLRQEYWSGLQFPSPGDLPDSGIERGSSVLQADSLLLSHWGSPYTIIASDYIGTEGEMRSEGKTEKYFSHGISNI